MKEPGFKGVFFDLDGTLINSAPMIIKAIQVIFKKHHLGPISPDIIKNYAGMPPDSIFRVLAPEQKDLLLQETITLEKKYRDLAPAYPGIKDLIYWLSQLDIRLAVITSQAHQEMEQVKNAYSFSKWIDFWISCDDIQHPKPDPESILVTLDQLELQPDRVLFVGDTEYDIKAGKSAGVVTGGALWGGHNHQLMKDLNPDHLFLTPGEIRELFFP